MSGSLTVTFRENLKTTDIEIIRAIVESSGFFSKEEIDIAVELVLERQAKGEDSGYYFLFSEQSGQVVGYTCFGPIPGTKGSFDLYWIAVHNTFRGLGIGKKLLAKSETIIRKMGGRRIYIETSSRLQYESTRLFYVRCGYKKEAILKDFYAPGDDKVIYVKELLSLNNENT